MLTYKIELGGRQVMELVNLIRKTAPASIPDYYPTITTVRVEAEHAQPLVDALNENKYSFYLEHSDAAV